VGYALKDWRVAARSHETNLEFASFARTLRDTGQRRLLAKVVAGVGLEPTTIGVWAIVRVLPRGNLRTGENIFQSPEAGYPSSFQRRV
jgi:hypothetical protein